MPVGDGSDMAAALDIFKRELQHFQSLGRHFQVVSTIRHPNSGASVFSRPQPPDVSSQFPLKRLVVLDSSFNPPTIAHQWLATSALRDVWRKEGLRPAESRLLLLLAVNNADKGVKPAAFEHRLTMMAAFARDLLRSSEQTESSIDKSPLPSDGGSSTLKGQPSVDSAEDLAIDIALTTFPYFHDKSAAIASSEFYSGHGVESPEQLFLAGFDTLIRIFNPKYYKPPVPEEGIYDAHETPMQSALDPFLGRARLRITMRTDDDWGGKDEQLAYVDSMLHGDELENVGGRKEWASRVELVEGIQADEGAVSSTLARNAAKQEDWKALRSSVSEPVATYIQSQGLYSESS